MIEPTVRRLLVSVALLGAAGSAAAQTPDHITWHVGGPRPREFVVTDIADRGRAVTVRRVARTPLSPSTFASTVSRVSADSFAGRRVRLTAELRTRDAQRGASVWVRLDDKSKAMLGMDNGEIRKLGSDQDWTPWTTELYVPPETDSVVFGLLLWGGGEVGMRALTLAPAELPLADAPTLPAARALLDSAIAIARRESVQRDTVSWDVLIPELRRLVAGATTVEDAYPALQRLVARLGDHHSSFFPPSNKFARGLRRDADTGQGEEDDVEAQFLARERVGYLSVPAHSGVSVIVSGRYVARAMGQLLAQRERGACGWVVDLRANGGGNMWPMLAVLRPLLGEGRLGAFVAKDVTEHWGARAADDTSDQYVQGLARWPDLTDRPVAVLTGSRTASSGEAVTIAFKGRPNTRSFGAPTAGFTSGNEPYVLPGGAVLNLATVFEADRTGVRYDQKVVPDELVAEENGRDAPLERALEWLSQQRGCSAARP